MQPRSFQAKGLKPLEEETHTDEIQHSSSSPLEHADAELGGWSTRPSEQFSRPSTRLQFQSDRAPRLCDAPAAERLRQTRSGSLQGPFVLILFDGPFSPPGSVYRLPLTGSPTAPWPACHPRLMKTRR